MPLVHGEDEHRPYIFVSKLVDREVHRSKGAPADFLLDHILVDSVFSSSVILARSVLRACVERLLSRIVRTIAQWDTERHGKTADVTGETLGWALPLPAA